MEQQKLWVEPVGGLIVARLRGVCTEQMLTECQERVLAQAKDTRQTIWGQTRLKVNRV